MLFSLALERVFSFSNAHWKHASCPKGVQIYNYWSRNVIVSNKKPRSALHSGASIFLRSTLLVELLLEQISGR